MEPRGCMQNRERTRASSHDNPGIIQTLGGTKVRIDMANGLSLRWRISAT